MTAPKADGASAIDQVWLLIHHHSDPTLVGEVDDKFIGFFSSEARAREAQTTVVQRPGFNEFPDDFEIVQLPIDAVLPPPGVRLQY